MARKIATDEAVEAVAEALCQEGIEPTTKLVQERTGGSLSTVGPALERWRNKRSALHQAEPAPADLAEKCDQFLRVLWSQAKRQADGVVLEVRRGAQAAAEANANELRHAHAEVMRLEQEGIQLEAQLAEAKQAMDLAREHAQTYAQRLTHIEAECARAAQELGDARAESKVHLARASELEGECRSLKKQMADLLAAVGRARTVPAKSKLE